MKENSLVYWILFKNGSTIDVTDRYGPTGDIKIETSRPGQLIYLEL